MKVTSQSVKLPSKARYLAQVGNFVPSNLHKQVNIDPTASLSSTASKTFGQGMFPRDSKNGKNKQANHRTVSFDSAAQLQEALKNNPNRDSEDGLDKENINIQGKKSSLLSGSSSSIQFSPVRNGKRQLQGEEEKKEEPKKKKERRNKKGNNKSSADPKKSLPGNYEHPEVLYKGMFQNNYMRVDSIGYNKNGLHQVPVRGSYHEYEEQYKMSRRGQSEDLQRESADHQSSQKYLEKRLSLYNLIDVEDLDPLQKDRRKLTITDKVSRNEEDIMNPNYLPAHMDFKKLPGNFGNEAVLSDKEKSVIKIQGLVRGMIERKRIAKMKQRVKQHLNGEQEVDPYEVEFYDLNIPIFQQILNINGELSTKKQEKENTLKAEDPDRKILSNTFFSALRNTAFPEDPMDYVVLAELQGEKDATFPRLLQEEEKRKSKEVTLVKKYEYLFGKPSLFREIKTDEKSVVSSFLKNNLSSIKDSDLKVGKFQTDYKSKFKPKVQPHAQPTYQSTQQQGSPRGRMSLMAQAAARSKKRFDTQIIKKKDDEDINTEISEDYPEDFEESAIKDSIQEDIHGGRSMTQSMIKESIMGDTRGKDAYMSDSIRESIIEQSSPGKFGHRYSNKSISEEIIGESIRGFNKNSSFKSIQEEIPISESINNSVVKPKKPRKQSEEIEEDIKDSYADEEFESLEEDIQESIEKFQSMRRSSSPSSIAKNNQSGKKVISPEKLEITKPVFKKTMSKEEEEISPIGKFRPSTVQSRIPETENRKRNENLLPSGGSEENDQSFGKEEVRRRIIDPNLIDLPQSNTAEILYANFQKELEKLIYVDSLSKKVHSLENTIDNMYNQKEVNLLHSLQNDAKRRFITGKTELPDPKLEQNTNVYLMQKYNTLERSMAVISNQLNFLINNFTGGQIPAAQSQGGSVGASARKPRPIIPITRNQPMKRKETTSVSTTVPPAQQQQQQKQPLQLQPQVQQAQAQVQAQAQKITRPVQQPQPVKKHAIEEEIVEEIELPKQPEQKKIEQKPLVVEPKPMILKKDESKPKFAFKLPTPTMPKEEEADKSFEIIPPVETKKKQEVKPLIVEEEKPAPVNDLKVSEYKSAKFGKWQQESSSSGHVSEEIIEDLDDEKPIGKMVTEKKSSEEEVDFSAKEYSESFEKSDTLVTPKKAFLPPQKFGTKEHENTKQETSSVKAYSESFEELTPRSTSKKASPVKADPQKKDADSMEEYDFDEEIDLPSDKSEKEVVPVKKTSYSLPPLMEPKKVVKEEPKPVVKEEKEEIKEVKKEVPIDDVPLEESIEDYADDDFEELSQHSEKEEVKPVIVKKEPVQEVKQPAWKNVQEEVKNPVVDSHSDSVDIEASDDLSQISWQDHIFPGEKKEPEPIKKKEPEPLVKKVEPVEDKDKDKKNLAPLGEIKLKGKYLNPLPEHKDIDIHQQEAPIKSPEKKEVQEEISPEEQKHKKHVEKINKDLGVITDKLRALKKEQVIRKAMNHINYAAPTEKLNIFDRAPVEDKAIVDAYNEVFLNIFRSELGKLNSETKNAKDVEAKMQIKMGMIISKSKEILLKKITPTSSLPPEDYSNVGKTFMRVYGNLKDKRIPNEENEFYEEENDIKHLIQDNKKKLKEDIANQVTEALFEEVARELLKLSKK